MGLVFLILAGVMIYGLTLPKEWMAETEVTIEAPSAAIYRRIGPLQNWEDWAIWFEHDPDMQVNYSGPPEGPGATYRWNGNASVGNGMIRIDEEVPGQKLVMTLTMHNDKFLSTGQINMIPGTNTTRVTWRLGGSFGSDPFARYNRKLLEQSVENTLSNSLQKLKTVMEQ
jgi:hypothetical protein